MTVWKRPVWAVQHAHRISLIEAINGRQALEIAKRLFGPDGGPYKVPRNQKQEMIAANLMGTKIITRSLQRHATEDSPLPLQPARRKRDAR